MATLTDEKQSLTRAVLITGVSTHRASLARVVGIHLESHRIVQEGFIGNHGLQLSKRPLRVTGVGLTLRARRFLALLADASLTNICQIFQSNEGMRMSFHNALTHDMIGILLQPSLSSTNHDKSSCSRTSAFLLQTPSQACVVIGLGNHGFARMEGGSPFMGLATAR